MQQDKIRWGIIGCGDVCEKKSAPAMNKIPGSVLQAVTRRNLDKAKDYAARHAVPLVCEDAATLIAHPEIDIVYIATPPDSHAQYTIMAAEAGKPVYVEKPMARTAKECQWMIEACHHAGVPLFVAYYRRSLPVFLKVKELLEMNAIGELRLVSMEMLKSVPELDKNSLPWRLQPIISGGGLFFDLGSHQIDLLDFFFGPVKNVQGVAVNSSQQSAAEDTVLANFSFESGLQASARWCFSVAPGFEKDRVEIYGNSGKISFSVFGNQEIHLQHSDRTNVVRFEPPAHIQQPCIESIIAELSGTGKCPSTGLSALRTAQVMDVIVAEYREKKGIKF
ncbi:MAG: gfo/Idh/MocA family oxidoreductase [Calditrichaeota bacterium]|nr:MAG: gfo/Idh/MocA family oxidoreductase [Calditrichota bacterium]